MPEKIGFVGVGRMGANMARRLKECGYEVAAVYDVNAPAAQALAQELGCSGGAESQPRSPRLADVIITVVTDDKAMKSYLSTAACCVGRAGKLFINCATVTPEVQSGWRPGPGKPARSRSRPAWPPASPRRARARST